MPSPGTIVTRCATSATIPNEPSRPATRSTPERIAVAATGFGLLVALFVPPASGAAAQVTVRDFQFSPTPLVVAQGASLTWHNNGPHTHTSTGDTPLGPWATGNIAPERDERGRGLPGGRHLHVPLLDPRLDARRRPRPILVSPASGTTATTFTATATGTYAFRSRLVCTSTHAASKRSPMKRVTVT